MNIWNQPRRSDRGGRPNRSGAERTRGGAAQMLLNVVDVSLAGTIFLAPLVLGGRHDLGRFIFIFFVAVAATAWAVRQALTGEASQSWRPAQILFGAAVLAVAFQLVPLPADWLARLSPRTAEFLPLWTGAQNPAELGEWQTLSLTPQATRLALAMLVAYGLLFFTVVQRLAGEADVERLLKWMALSAGLIAVLGIVQWAVPNGKFLWVYDHPSRDARQPSGPFVNRNHFAHFLALGLPAIVAWLTIRLQPRLGQDRRASLAGRGAGAVVRRDVPAAAIGALLVVVAGAALMSCSRGGIIALAVSAGVMLICLHRKGLLGGRRAAALAAAGAVALGAVSLVSYDRLANRLSSLSARSLDELDASSARRKIWKANLAAIRAGGWFGAGAGSHAEVYPLYLDDPPTKRYTHAESGYLQIVTENGAPGAALLAAAALLVAVAGWRAWNCAESPGAKACASAAIAALAASFVHSAFDFVWYIPACLTPAVLFAACLVRLSRPSTPAASLVATSSNDRSLAALRAGAVGVAALLMTVEFIGPAAASASWDAYLRKARAHREFTHKLLAMLPADAESALAESGAAQQATLEAMIAELERAVARYPGFAAAHSALANRCLQLFNLKQLESDNPMPASQISGAAVASRFSSSAELRRWLDRAVGPNSRLLDRALFHAQAAVRQAPLEGAAYAVLAEVCFLRGEGVAEADAYLGQALLVRPYDGDLLFEIGVQWTSRGVVEAGLECWRRAMRLEGPHRIMTARCLAGRLPAAAIISDFAPQWDTLPEFWPAARGSQPEMDAWLAYAEEQARRESPTLVPVHAARMWRTLAQMEMEASRPERALAVLAYSAERHPGDYATRRALGVALADAGRLDDAAPHLQWCLQRRPNDKVVERLLIRAGRQRLAARPR